MIKKIGFAVLIFFPLILVTQSFQIETMSFGLLDYINLLFYNTSTYSMYQIDSKSLMHFIFYFLLLIGGFYFVSEPIHLRHHGFNALEVIRYPSCAAFLTANRKRNLKHAAIFLLAAITEIALAILIIDPTAYTRTSPVFSLSSITWISAFLSFLVRIITALALFELWCEFLLYKLRFEVLLTIALILVCFLVQVGVQANVLILSFSLEPEQYAITALFVIVYIFSDRYILKKYHTKEIW